MKLNEMVLASTFALATLILWVLCSAFVWLLPDFSLMITEWWMHGLDMSVMGDWNLSLYNLIAGGVTLTVSGWVTGYVFGWSWRKMSKK